MELLSAAHLLCRAAADHGVLLLGAAGRQDGPADLRRGRAAWDGLRDHPGHIARHDR